MSGGSVFVIFSISARTFFAISTVLAPVCLVIISRAPSNPLIFSSKVTSLIVSRTVAKSRTKTCLPSRVVITTMSFISELSLYSLSTLNWYCSFPILTVPEAKFKLFVAIALPTASTLKWYASSCLGSKSM